MAVLSGKASWFNHGPNEPGPGPADSTNSGQASGISFNQPGIAVMNASTLRGYWLVKGSDGHAFIVQQTDVGPAHWTGRIVDFNYAARQSLLGGADPTDKNYSLVYLGQNIDNSLVQNYKDGLNQLNISSDQVPADPAFFSKLKQNGFQAVNFDALTPSVGGKAYTDATSAAADAARNATNGLGDLIKTLLDPHTWLHVLEALMGVFLLMFAIFELAGGKGDHVVRAVRRPIRRVRSRR